MLRNDVNSLLIFIDPDEQPPVVIIEALHALRHLAQEAVRNERQLFHFQSTVGLQSLLNKILVKENFNDDCQKVASEILFLSKCNSRPMSNEANSGVITRAGMRTARKTTKEPVKFLGGNKKAKVIMLQIEGLEGEESKQECTNELLRVTGVISITFNMVAQRCTIRARSDMHAESLVHAIHNTKKMTAKQVMKNEIGEEVLVSFDDKDRTEELPPYLEEDLGDSPNKEENKQSVARPGYTEAVGTFAKSWFGSVVSAVNKNLYW